VNLIVIVFVLIIYFHKIFKSRKIDNMKIVAAEIATRRQTKKKL